MDAAPRAVLRENAPERTPEERRRGVQPLRRVFHAGSGLTMAFAPPFLGLGTREVVTILAVTLVVLFAFDFARLRIPALNALF